MASKTGPHICNHCGNTFYGWSGNVNKFCGISCYHKERWLDARVIRYCKNCSNGFLARKQEVKRGSGIYCGIKCLGESKKTGKYKNCKNCGNEFYVSQCEINIGAGKFCTTECFDEFRYLYPKTRHLRSRVMQRQRIRNLHDYYIKKLLIEQIDLKPDDIPEPVIKAKRQHLKIKRLIKDKTQ